MVVVDSAGTGSLPEVALAPDHAPVPPEAVQEVAFVEDQVSVDALDTLAATTAGVAATDTVTDGGGGVPGTVTVADALAPPQVKEKLLLAVSAPVD